MNNYLPTDLPLPYPMPDDAEWWRRCGEGLLAIQRCVHCGTLRHPPIPTCGHCRSFEYDWQEVSGNGVVFSFTIVRNAAAHPALKGYTPYNVVVVELEDAPGIRLVSNLVDVPPEQVAIGLPVEAIWEKADEVITLPRFRLRKPTSD